MGRERTVRHALHRIVTIDQCRPDAAAGILPKSKEEYRRVAIARTEPSMPNRVAFVTIGQSPRSDVVPDLLADTRMRFEVTERGALDGLEDAAIANLAPRAGEERL